MKFIHYVVVILLVGMLFFYGFYDEYHEYGASGIRVKAYETEEIIRVYVEEQKMIQVVDTHGYHEHLKFAVEIENGQIVGFQVISHNETEDYGGYITETWFENRLLLPCDVPLTVVKLSKNTDNEVVAVTGATITTQSIVNGVNECIKNYWRYLDEV